jgi:hypothetical protein
MVMVGPSWVDPPPVTVILGALGVELWDSHWPRVVDGQGLDAEEVLPVGNAGGEAEGVGFCG